MVGLRWERPLLDLAVHCSRCPDVLLHCIFSNIECKVTALDCTELNWKEPNSAELCRTVLVFSGPCLTALVLVSDQELKELVVQLLDKS